MAIDPGLEAELTFPVTEADTASTLGSGDLPVLGTPRMLAWFEAATVAALQGTLVAGQSSVGTRVQLEHTRASAVGTTITVRARLVAADGRLLRFDVAAEDSSGAAVGHATVTRVVVDAERFLARLSDDG